MVAVATLVLVIVTGWGAWTNRSLVRETHHPAVGCPATLQARMDRISEICIREPNLFPLLDEQTATGEEEDGRFHLANMFLGVLEEAHTQHAIERTMSDDDWSAWVATAEVFLPRQYVVRYWERVARTFEPAFQRFVKRADYRRQGPVNAGVLACQLDLKAAMCWCSAPAFQAWPRPFG